MKVDFDDLCSGFHLCTGPEQGNRAAKQAFMYAMPKTLELHTSKHITSSFFFGFLKNYAGQFKSEKEFRESINSDMIRNSLTKKELERGLRRFNYGASDKTQVRTHYQSHEYNVAKHTVGSEIKNTSVKNIKLSYDGGRVYIYLNDEKVYGSTLAGNDFSIEVEVE
ncbi:hypothetical protein ASwh1_34 [Aeromonas phage Aswh_1]|nr:hypothetical protein ASwh1_34 [Aeromonas phage Aswh_1]